MELKWCSAHRMAECQSGGVEGLARSGALQQLRRPAWGPRNPPAASAAIDRIAYDGVSNVLQMDPDLMGPAGVKLEAEQIHDVEARDHGRVGPRRAAV